MFFVVIQPEIVPVKVAHSLLVATSCTPCDITPIGGGTMSYGSTFGTLSTSAIGAGLSTTLDTLQPGVLHTFTFTPMKLSGNYTAAITDGGRQIAAITMTAMQTYNLSFTPSGTSVGLTISANTATASSIQFTGWTWYSYVNEPEPVVVTICGSDVYRFGFNGKTKDNQWAGLGNHYDYGERMFDPRIARWLSLDKSFRKYPAISPYVFGLNSPIFLDDPDGRDARVTVQRDKNGGGKITIATTIFITGANANKFNADAYTKAAAERYKPGTYTDAKGNKFNISFDVKYQYVDDKSKIQLQPGDNILNYTDENTRSNVQRNFTYEKSDKGDANVQTYVGHEGTIGAQDAIGASSKATVHESLHLLGLSDRYQDDANGKSVPDKGFEKDEMGSYNGKEMSQVHYDNWGQAYSDKADGTYILQQAVDTKSSDGSLIGGSSDGQRPAITK